MKHSEKIKQIITETEISFFTGSPCPRFSGSVEQNNIYTLHFKGVEYEF